MKLQYQGYWISLLALLLSAGLFFSCEKNPDPVYEGTNYLYLTAENTSISEDSETPIVVQLELTKALQKDLSIGFSLEGNSQEIVEIEGDYLNIKAGNKKGTIRIFSNKKNLLKQEQTLILTVTDLPEDVKLKEPLRLLVKPAAQTDDLTPEERALVNAYKERFGIDMAQWLGVFECSTKVMMPANDSYAPFAEEKTYTYTSRSVISLSPSADKEHIVLQMKENAFGLTEYLFWVLRKLTVENDEYWYGENANPFAARIMALLNWSREQPGTFSVALDKITVQPVDGQSANIVFFADGKIPFAYTFSPWEKQKSLIAEGNADAIELNGGEDGEGVDGTADPNYYLNKSSVEEDEFEEPEQFIAPKGEIKEGKMTFQFVLDYEGAAGYSRAYVTCTKVK